MKKFEYMKHNITDDNLVKYANKYGDEGWIMITCWPHRAADRAVLGNTVHTVVFARERLPFTGDPNGYCMNGFPLTL